MLKQKGITGERFFHQRHNELLQYPVVPILNMGDWDIEGSDIAAERLMWKAPEKGAFDNGKEEIMPYLEYGGIEIKTIGSDQFFPRFGVDDMPCGTIGVPIWGKTKDLSNGRTEYTRNDYGNLYRWMHPSIEDHSSRPMIMIHLLKADNIDMNEHKAEERFCAAIAFEDMSALINRLISYAERYGLNLRDWSSIPVGDAAKDYKIDGLYFQGNMWQVPLKEIGDIATVTMIGEDPMIYHQGGRSAPVSVQYERLCYLKELANGRWIPQDKISNSIQSDEELKELWHNRFLFSGVKYPGLLDIDGRLMNP